MLKKGHDLKPVIVEAEENPHAHVFDSSLHGPVHGGQMVEVVRLGTAGVHGLEGPQVVGLLEELVGPDPRLFEAFVALHGKGGDVDVDTADLPVGRNLDRIDRLDGLDGVVHRREAEALAGDEKDPLVPLGDQNLRLPLDLFDGQRLTGDLLVALAEGAVEAVVHAEVGDVEGGEENEPTTVNLVLDKVGRLEDLLQESGIFEHQKAFGPVEADSLQLTGLLQNLPNLRLLGGKGVGEVRFDLSVVDETRVHCLSSGRPKSFAVRMGLAGSPSPSASCLDYTDPPANKQERKWCLPGRPQGAGR